MADDAVTLIKNDHRVMERLFERLKSGDGDRRALVAEIAAMLNAHSRAEEEQVYPAIANADPEEVEHAYEEHEEAEDLLHRLQQADPDRPEFQRALVDLLDAVTHHVEEEERAVLPALEQAVDRQTLERLGADFMRVRRAELAKAGFGADRA
jgi:hemerythrin superfamily protein